MTQDEMRERNRAWVTFAASALGGMLASAPISDRMNVNAVKWAIRAGEFADALTQEYFKREM